MSTATNQSFQISSKTPTSKNKESEATKEPATYTPYADHLQNSSVTKVSPRLTPFISTSAAESEFNRLCKELKGPLQMVPKKEIKWDKKDPLHFWQSLAFTLRNEELTCVAVSSFADTLGENKLYIASNDPMNATQQQEITEVINMFIDLKPMNEIADKLLPRQVSYIIKQCKKCGPVDDFFAKVDALN